MSELTPALDRATDALLDTPGDVTAVERNLAYNDARTAVSAALHDPDDPDWLARLGFDSSQEWVEADGVTTRLDWTHLHLSQQQRWRAWADAVRAAILGEA